MSLRTAPSGAPPPLAGQSIVGAVALSGRRFVAVTRLGGDRFRLAGGEIALTLDAGHHWRAVLSQRRAQFSWVQRDGRELIAAGALLVQVLGGTTFGDARLWISGDAGRRWHEFRPRGPGAGRLYDDTLWPSAHGVLLAMPDVNQGLPTPVGSISTGVLRSTDGGRVWRRVRLPGSGSAYGSASWVGSTVFVTGVAGRCQALWRSGDGGLHFTRLPGICHLGRNQTIGDGIVVDFLTARDGFLAGGGIPKFSSGQWLYGTTDGGAHWHLRWHDLVQYGEPEIAELDFVTARDGWAVPGGDSDAADFSYLGHLLHTTDGGRHWVDTGQTAGGVSALADGHTALAFRDVDNPNLPFAGDVALTPRRRRALERDLGRLGPDQRTARGRRCDPR